MKPVARTMLRGEAWSELCSVCGASSDLQVSRLHPRLTLVSRLAVLLALVKLDALGSEGLGVTTLVGDEAFANVLEEVIIDDGGSINRSSGRD